MDFQLLAHEAITVEEMSPTDFADMVVTNPEWIPGQYWVMRLCQVLREAALDRDEINPVEKDGISQPFSMEASNLLRQSTKLEGNS